ncbi:hypothetical protein [Aeromonas enteropelogenes]|uniref:hypothetical protein n=1 Tax=Aeromonas enteropelogenes TaxID=29489 RepID=UPI003BA0C19E
MDHVNHWNQLFHMYKNCSRIGMLKRNGHKRWYWIGISSYVAISVLVFLWTKDSSYNLVLTIVTEFAVAFLVGYMLSWRIGRYAKECSSLSVSERELYARYRMFRMDFKSNRELSSISIDNLLAWNEARFKKLDILSLFHNPIFILILSAIMSTIVSMELVKNNSGFVLVLIVYFIMGIIPLLWLLQDYLYSEKKKYFNICKFLKWIELDNNIMDSTNGNYGPRFAICDGRKIKPFSRRRRVCGSCLR